MSNINKVSQVSEIAILNALNYESLVMSDAVLPSDLPVTTAPLANVRYVAPSRDVTLRLDYRCDTGAFLEVYHPVTGAVCWIKKTADIVFAVNPDEGTVMVTMFRTLATRRKFIAAV